VESHMTLRGGLEDSDRRIGSGELRGWRERVH
jgi:hypothetical protein